MGHVRSFAKPQPNEHTVHVKRCGGEFDDNGNGGDVDVGDCCGDDVDCHDCVDAVAGGGDDDDVVDSRGSIDNDDGGGDNDDLIFYDDILGSYD